MREFVCSQDDGNLVNMLSACQALLYTKNLIYQLDTESWTTIHVMGKRAMEKLEQHEDNLPSVTKVRYHVTYALTIPLLSQRTSCDLL